MPSTAEKKSKERKFTNRYKRMHEAKKAAHVLVTEHENGSATCSQFTPENSRLFRPAIISSPSRNNITSTRDAFRTPHGRNNKFNLDVNTPNGTVLVSNRSMTIKTKKENEDTSVVQQTLFFLSPPRVRQTQTTTPETSDSVPNPRKRKINLISSTNANTKGGRETVLLLSKRRRRLAPPQNQVMGKTAKEALIDCIEANKDRYEDHILKLLNSLVNESFEWLHCLAFSLCPRSINPQRASNLASGPKWINTYMMILESVAYHFARQYPGSVRVTPTFTMLPNSKIVDEITYIVSILRDEREVTVSNTIKALRLQDASSWPSASDVDQTIRVIDVLLNEEPASEELMLFLR